MAIVSFSKMHIKSRARLLENNLHGQNKINDTMRIRTCDRDNKSTSAINSYRRY